MSGPEGPDPSRWPSHGEAVLFLSWGDIKAVIRGWYAVAGMGGLPTDNPGDYTRADLALRVLLQVARRRLRGALGLKSWYYLDPHAWPPGAQVPVFVNRAAGEALARAAVACRVLGTVHGRDTRPWYDRTRRQLRELLESAEAQFMEPTP